MGDRLKGKSIAITGSGRGIGRSLALMFASEGARIIVADYGGDGEGGGAASSRPADDVVAEIQKAGGEAVAAYDDVSTDEGGAQVVETALEHFGRIDGLVCNAGIMAPDKPLYEISGDEWDTVLRVNLKGQFCPVKAALPHMLKQGSGRLIYVSSSSAIASDHGSVSQEVASPYGVSKAGVLNLMWQTAVEFMPHGITSNAIMPGAATRLIDMRLPDADGAKAFHSSNALGTWRDPKHIAPIVAYLLSDFGAQINGQLFGVMGGRLARYSTVFPQRSIDASEGVGFSLDELIRRFPDEFGKQLDYEPALFPPPATQ